MSKKISLILVSVILITTLMSCAAHRHVIGKGATMGQSTSERQWYILYGLIPLNKVDTSVMAGGKTDYEIKTEQSAIDILLNLITGYLTIYSRTVTVTK
jgi:hypothetical protein